MAENKFLKLKNSCKDISLLPINYSNQAGVATEKGLISRAANRKEGGQTRPGGYS